MPIRLALALVCGLALAAPSIADTPPPPPPSSHSIVPVRQVDWELVARTYPMDSDVNANRILYARRPRQAAAWGRLKYGPADAALRQDFSRYGLLAVFLTRQFQVNIDRVDIAGGDGLNVKLDFLPVTNWEDCPAGCIPTPYPSAQFLLIRIRKDSLTAPPKRLYISFLSDSPQPPVRN